MQEISAEVLRWLPKLWRVGVEKGLETQLVRKSLVLCTSVINQAAECGSRWVQTSGSSPPSSIDDWIL